MSRALARTISSQELETSFCRPVLCRYSPENVNKRTRVSGEGVVRWGEVGGSINIQRGGVPDDTYYIFQQTAGH